MSADDLNAAWTEIVTPTTSGALAGRLAPDLDPQLGVTLALDSSGLRHLLVPTSKEAKAPTTSATKGLQITVEELKVGSQPARHFLDVACGDPSMHHNFAVVGAEILDALRTNAVDPLKTLKQILARWKWFWSVPLTGLSEEKMVGLFGELWFLEYWLGGADEQTLAAWRGPFGDRHDFKWPAASVEVKGTRVRSDGAARHRISTLDQLEDAAQGKLHLFSLRVRPDTVAAHSLVASVDRIRQSLQANADLLVTFDELLGRAGYSPAHREKYTATLRVVAEELYEVTDGFPRLTTASFTNGVPAGVEDIAYTLDLAVCQQWLVAKSPVEAADLWQSMSSP